MKQATVLSQQTRRVFVSSTHPSTLQFTSLAGKLQAPTQDPKGGKQPTLVFTSLR